MEVPVIRIARESLALVSVVSFVWMMCSVAQLVA
ncbi:cell division inhibitor SidA [Caulobacter sp. ErkDOM-E]